MPPCKATSSVRDLCVECEICEEKSSEIDRAIAQLPITVLSRSRRDALAMGSLGWIWDWPYSFSQVGGIANDGRYPSQQEAGRSPLPGSFLLLDQDSMLEQRNASTHEYPLARALQQPHSFKRPSHHRIRELQNQENSDSQRNEASFERYPSQAVLQKRQRISAVNEKAYPQSTWSPRRGRWFKGGD